MSGNLYKCFLKIDKTAMPEKICNDEFVQGKLMDLPGFRFYPTEEELLGFYLKKKIREGHPLIFDKIIPTLDLYQYDPWELPGIFKYLLLRLFQFEIKFSNSIDRSIAGLAHDVGERQWFFFVPIYHKKCTRRNRLTVSGYWKATGSDRPVRNELLHCIGLKKTLVFYKGKSPGA